MEQQILSEIIEENRRNMERLTEQLATLPLDQQKRAQMSAGAMETAQILMQELLEEMNEHEKMHELGIEHIHDEEEHEHHHEHTHEHDGELVHTHDHGHFHDPKEKKKQLNRLARVIGHLEYVKRMMQADEDCAEVLMQLAANKSALSGLGKEIIHEHLNHCIIHAIEDGDTKTVDEFQKVLQKYL